MKKRKKSANPAVEKLSRRERQIMDILLRRREATALLVQADLPDPPSYDSVRTILRILTEKGVAVRRADGNRYIYAPAVDLDTARQVALTHLVRTFFQGSAGRKWIAMASTPGNGPSPTAPTKSRARSNTGIERMTARSTFNG